jgi:hypothetical protein
MRRLYTFCMAALLLLAPGLLAGQSRSQKFSVFYAKFQAAVAQQDQATLTRCSTPSRRRARGPHRGLLGHPFQTQLLPRK